MKNASHKLVILLVAAALALVLVSIYRQVRSSARQLISVETGRFMTMGTFARIQLRCRDEQIGRQALDQAVETLEPLDKIFSTYRDDSEISLVNRQAGHHPVKISDELFQVLLAAEKYSRLSDGAFDITVTPLIDLWRQAEKNARLPDEQEIEQAKAKVGYQKVILSATPEKTVSFSAEQVQLNLDAIAKGYIVDRVLAVLHQPGISAGLVDIGGEIAGFGQDQPGRDWLVGIQDPFSRENDNPLSEVPRWKIRLTNCAIATSGNYRRFHTIAGERFGHIIDPRTGRPADLLPSVTIIASDTTAADALATAASVMGPEKALALLESLKDTEAMLVAGSPENPKIYRTSGFNSFEAAP